MKRLIEIADQLNELLSKDVLDMTELQKLAQELDQLPYLHIKLIDFEQYNEENLSKLTEEKLKNIKEQNFEKAANLREQEKECFKYANFQKYFKLKDSFFYPEENKLFYFHLGTGNKDKGLKEYLFGE